MKIIDSEHARKSELKIIQKKMNNLEAKIEKQRRKDNKPQVLNERMRNYLRLPVGFDKKIESMVSLADYFKNTENFDSTLESEEIILFDRLSEDKQIEFTAYFIQNDSHYTGLTILGGRSYTKEELIEEVKKQTVVGKDVTETQSFIIKHMIEMCKEEFNTAEDLYKKFPEFKDKKVMY